MTTDLMVDDPLSAACKQAEYYRREAEQAKNAYRSVSNEAVNLTLKTIRQDAEIDELKDELKKRSKQIGVACLRHDLTHSLACGRCSELRDKEVQDLKAALCYALHQIEYYWNDPIAHHIEEQLRIMCQGINIEHQFYSDRTQTND